MMSAKSSQYGIQIEDLRRQLDEVMAFHKKIVGALEERIEDSERKIDIGNFSVDHENKYRANIVELQRKLKRATKLHRTTLDALERKISEFEKSINDAETTSSTLGPDIGWVSAFLDVLQLTGGSFEMSETSHDFGVSTNPEKYYNLDNEMTSLLREFQSVKSSTKKPIESIDKKLSRVENKISEEGSILRYIAPTLYGFSAAFTVLRSMQSQLQRQFLPAMLEIGFLSLPGIITYLS